MKKSTKIVATISDMRCDVEFLTTLYDNGVNVFRLNTAHQTPEDTIRVIQNIRAVSNKIAILVDTKGPEIRTSSIQAEPFAIKKGDEFYIRHDSVDAESTREVVQVSYAGIVADCPIGEVILIDDGQLKLTVIAKDEKGLKVRADNDGDIKKKKSVNLPNVSVTLPSVTEKDRRFIEMSIDQGVDFIAHSFVRCKQDVLDVQVILDAKKSNIKIISKIEDRQGVDNLDEILEVSYGIMVARGDLGIEIPAEEVPLVQKAMIEKCIRACKPVITATQMLESMIKNPRATRAEVSDVANAILDGTDAVMLSGETAYGDWPVEAVQTQARIASHIEKNMPPHKFNDLKINRNDLQVYTAKAAARAAEELGLDALIIPTYRGKTVRQLASHRINVPIYAACYEPEALRALGLSYGVEAYEVHVFDRSQIVRASLEPLLAADKIKLDDLVAFVMTTPGSPGGDSNRLEINTVKGFLDFN